MVFLTQPEVKILPGWDGWEKQTTDCIHNGAIGLLQVQKDALQTHQYPCYLPKTDGGDLSWGPLSPLVYHLFGWHSHLLQGSNQPPERLEAVFQKLEKTGLKLNPSKCELFQWQIAYLGHMISGQAVPTDEGKIDAIKNWPIPTNVTEVQSFLRFCWYKGWEFSVCFHVYCKDIVKCHGDWFFFANN